MTNDRTASYQSDALNRYSEREHPAAVDVRGLAPANVGVLVNSGLAIRTDEAFYAEALFDNSESALAAEVVVKALDPGPPERLAQESRNATIAQSPEAYQYDLDGNLLQDGLWDYTWDGQNRLVAMETRSDLAPSIPRQRLTFTYDSQSRRIGKTVEQWNGTAWGQTSNHRYLYDGWNLIAEYEFHSSEFTLHSSFLWGLDISGTPQGAGGVGGLLIASTDHGDHAPGYDGNGNIINWVDLSDGSQSGTAEYSPFGEVLTQSGVAKEISFGFSTKYTDNETGLLYYGFRYYDPETGRWPSRDPIEEEGGLNLYGFVGNDGVNSWDYLGLDFIAVASRPVDGFIFGHYSIEYWKSDCPGPSFDWPTVMEWGLANQSARWERVSAVELLNESGYVVWARVSHGPSSAWVEQRPAQTGAFGINGISVIFQWGSSYGRTSAGHEANRNFVSIFDSVRGSKVSKEDVRRRWQQIIQNAVGYQWAEQAVNREPPGNVSNWPRSKYSSLGTNSNVFVREMIRGSNLRMLEYGGRSHPPAAGTPPRQNSIPSSWLSEPWNPDFGGIPPARPSL